jgi:hypothetical protein
MSYSISRNTDNTEKAKKMAKDDGGGLSHLIIRLVNKEWKRRIKDEGK